MQDQEAGLLFGINPTQGGAVALLVIVVLMVLTGRLVPRRTHEDVREERNKWRDAHATSELARQAERDQVNELLELSRTAGRVLTALPRPHAGEEVDTSDVPMDQAPTPPR